MFENMQFGMRRSIVTVVNNKHMTYVMVCKDHSTINAQSNEDYNGFDKH